MVGTVTVSINSTSYKGSGLYWADYSQYVKSDKFPLIPLPIKEAVS